MDFNSINNCMSDRQKLSLSAAALQQMVDGNLTYDDINNKMSDQQKLSLIAASLQELSGGGAPEDVTIFIPNTDSTGSGTLTVSNEDYEAIRQVALHNIYHGTTAATGASTFLVKGKTAQVMLVFGRDYDAETGAPEWGGADAAVSYEFAGGETETIYLIFCTNWDSFGGMNYVLVYLTKENGTITGEWSVTNPS